MTDIPITLNYTDDVVDYLAENAYSPEYGARELRRFIQKEIEDPIANMVIDSFECPITTVDLTILENAVKMNTPASRG